MKERTHSDEQLAAAYRLANPEFGHQALDREWVEAWLSGGWESVHDGNAGAVAIALAALDELPNGWTEGQAYAGGRRFEHESGIFVALPVDCDWGLQLPGTVVAPDWPAAVRSGHASAACLLLAAYSELAERRKAVAAANLSGRRR